MEKPFLEKLIKEYEAKLPVAEETLYRAEVMERFVRRKSFTMGGAGDQALAAAQKNVMNINRNMKQDEEFLEFLKEIQKEK